jgi:acetyl esterase/lipase
MTRSQLQINLTIGLLGTFPLVLHSAAQRADTNTIGKGAGYSLMLPPSCSRTAALKYRYRNMPDYAAMKTFVIRAICVVLFLARLCAAQNVIPLYPGTAPGSTEENYPEKEYFSKTFSFEVVANVTRPSLTVFKPSPELRNGTAVVICPGGGFYFLGMKGEGYDVAKYLVAKGVTAFVLKYRLAHTGEDATQEVMTLGTDNPKFLETVQKIEPLAVADGLAAVTYVRQYAAEWGVSPDRVGIIGFSAGGGLTAGVASHYAPDGRPAFVAMIYAGLLPKDVPVPTDAPPMFLTVANDDQVAGVTPTLTLYEKWAGAHKSVELHIYAKGDHAFGMRTQNLPTDHWIDRFFDWLEFQGWLTK